MPPPDEQPGLIAPRGATLTPLQQRQLRESYDADLSYYAAAQSAGCTYVTARRYYALFRTGAPLPTEKLRVDAIKRSAAINRRRLAAQREAAAAALAETLATGPRPMVVRAYANEYVPRNLPTERPEGDPAKLRLLLSDPSPGMLTVGLAVLERCAGHLPLERIVRLIWRAMAAKADRERGLLREDRGQEKIGDEKSS